jgi:hypothetical protein
MYERICKTGRVRAGAPRVRLVGLTCCNLRAARGRARHAPACGNATARMPQAANFSMVDPENLGLE